MNRAERTSSEVKRHPTLSTAVARVLCATIVSTSFLSSSITHAQPTTSPNAADRETARSLMGEGDQKFEAKDYAGALRAYEGAHKIMGVPTTGIAVARALEALGDLIEARDVALQVARIPVTPNEPRPFAAARTDAESLADKLASKIATVKVEVSGVPAGTAVRLTIDGVAIPPEAASLPRKVNPGKRTVSASAPGFATATQELTLKPGATVEAKLALSPGNSTNAPGAGAGAGARTTVDGTTNSSANESDDRTWYVRAGLGLGYLQTNETVSGSAALPDVSATYSKAALGLDLGVGYRVGRGLVVGGELRLASMSNPDAKFGDVKVKTSGTLTTALLGPFVEWFPQRGSGWHVGGTIGFASLSHSQVSRGPKTEGGLGFSAMGGYDFYFSSNWAVGPFVDLSLLATSAKTSDQSKEKGSATAFAIIIGPRLLYF